MLELRAVPGETGRLLAALLRERGIELGTANPQGVVSYGVAVHTTLPSLNARAGTRNKLEELEALKAAGVSVPPFGRGVEGLTFPLVGRRLRHTRGRDIQIILGDQDEITWLRNAGRMPDYFTQYVPRAAEFRVWAYRRRCLAVYQKQMVRPAEYRDFGWGHGNGFAFNIVAGASEDVKALGTSAVDALRLDFGAADIIRGRDGHLYVLEVNTAPGVEGPRQGLMALANKIARWVELGYPRRNEAV